MDTHFSSRRCFNSTLSVSDYIPKLPVARSVVVTLQKAATGLPACSSVSSNIYSLDADFPGCVDTGSSNSLLNGCNATHRIDVQCVDDANLTCSTDCVVSYTNGPRTNLSSDCNFSGLCSRSVKLTRSLFFTLFVELRSCETYEGQLKRTQTCLTIPGTAPTAAIPTATAPTSSIATPAVTASPVIATTPQAQGTVPQGSGSAPQSAPTAPKSPSASAGSSTETLTISFIMFLFIAFAVL